MYSGQSDERLLRQQELHATIQKAKDELATFYPSKPFLAELEEELAEMEAEDNFESKIDKLGELAATALNLLIVKGEGEIVVKGGSQIELHTIDGHLTYDPDSDEWFYTGAA